MAELGQAVIGQGDAGAAFVIGPVDGAFEGAGHGGGALRFGVKREERADGARAGWIETLGGTVDDLPIAQVAASAERDGAGADAAQRQGNR